ncbi:MAG: hypothetical protein ACXWRE_04815 [Pseudobdellovibrionaceae bacterium]
MSSADGADISSNVPEETYQEFYAQNTSEKNTSEESNTESFSPERRGPGFVRRHGYT